MNMKKTFGIMAAAAAVLTLGSCQGRTESNMTPNGDTVEVYVDSTEIVVSDSPSAPEAQNEFPDVLQQAEP